MSDKEARALGAGSVIEVEVDGEKREYRLAPLSIRPLAEVQRLCVEQYKRNYLKTYADNLDLLGNGEAQQLVREKLDEVAAWDIGNLPKKISHSASNVKMNAALRSILIDKYGEIPKGRDAQVALLETALDEGKITAEVVEKLTKTRPVCAKVSYDSWWVTACYDGMVAFVWGAFRTTHPDITRDDISGWPLLKIIEAARLAERITAPAVGNM